MKTGLGKDATFREFCDVTILRQLTSVANAYFDSVTKQDRGHPMRGRRHDLAPSVLSTPAVRVTC